MSRFVLLAGLLGCSSSTRSVDVLTTFDPAMGQLPEGLALRGDTAYVGFAPAASIVTVDRAGRVTPYATVPSTAGGTKGFTLGLLFGGAGELYVAQASFDPSVAPGIYRIPDGGGAATVPWAADPALTFPNAMAFDAHGTMFVADSSGAIFTIDPAGRVGLWKRDAVLAGDPNACPDLLPIPIGANGIVVTATDVWVTHTDRGGLIRIPITADGSAGTPRVVVEDCAFAGLDGLVRRSDGSFVAAINGQNELVRLDEAGTASTILAGAPLDFPASVAVGDDGALVITAAAFVTAMTGMHPAPALVSIEE